MFTGLIQEVGTIQEIKKNGHHIQLTCQASKALLADYLIGDSLAINGVCLTAIAKTECSFTVDVMPETFNRTTFSTMTKGSLVNLERAMLATGRLEGHLVAGHVDCTTRLIKKMSNENAVVLTFQYPHEQKGEIVPQGSIAINGVSLTVSVVTPGTFSVSLIPHSLAKTNLNGLLQGSQVNIETDMLGKYVKTMLRMYPNPTLNLMQ